MSSYLATIPATVSNFVVVCLGAFDREPPVCHMVSGEYQRLELQGFLRQFIIIARITASVSYDLLKQFKSHMNLVNAASVSLGAIHR